MQNALQLGSSSIGNQYLCYVQQLSYRIVHYFRLFRIEPSVSLLVLARAATSTVVQIVA